jgi:DeoR family transcriptional regulator, fructose operon transcriptional repressor
MFAHERFRAILDLLARKQRLTVQELRQAVHVSSATLRRDLAQLEAEGKVVRVHGGLVHPQALHGESTFDERSREVIEVKRAMAAAASKLVEPRSSVLIDAGTTCYEVGKALMTRRDLTIITNSIPLAELGQHAAAKVVCLGGEIRGTTGALTGALSLSWLEHLRADWAFVGASGLSERDGASTTELSEAAIKQAMLSRARRKVLMADGTKWDRAATVRFAGWQEFDYWITSSTTKLAAVKAVKKRGPRVIRVAPSAG